MALTSDLLLDPSFVLGIISNLLALYLVATKSGKRLAEYRKLLIIFLISDLVFTVIQDVLKPSAVVAGNLFIMFPFSEVQSKWLISVYTGCVSISFVIFSFHFAFRAVAISSKQYFVARLEWWKLTLICLAFLAEGVAYTLSVYTRLNCEWKCQADAKSYFKTKNFTIIDDPLNQVLLFRPYIPGESPIIITIRDMGAPIALLSVSAAVIIVSSAFVIKKLREKTVHSGAYRHFHRRIFIALVAQISIPCLLLYAPAGFCMITPFFAPPSYTSPAWIVRDLYSLYPILDPLAIIFLISDYRKALFSAVRIVPENPSRMPSSTHPPQ